MHTINEVHLFNSQRKFTGYTHVETLVMHLFHLKISIMHFSFSEIIHVNLQVVHV